MRSKSIALLALALGCGLVASIGISQLIDAQKKSVDDGEKLPVFVAMVDVGPNEELTAQNIKLEEWPKDKVPQGALTKLEEVEGRRCRTKLYAGEPVLSPKLLGANDSLGAAKDIPPGFRVAHVHVDSVTGSSNLILPGDRVDVLVFRNPNSDTNATAAKIVLQDIKVFAVDTHTETEMSHNKSGDGSEPMTAKSISLLVTPQQAVVLHAATQVGGSVRLALRNPDDDAHVNDEGVNLTDIFGPEHPSDRKSEHADSDKSNLTGWLDQQKAKEKAAPVPPQSPAFGPGLAAAAPRKMIVMMGAQISEVEFTSAGGLPVNQPQQDAAGAGDKSPVSTLPADVGGETSFAPVTPNAPEAEEAPSAPSTPDETAPEMPNGENQEE